MHGIPHSWCICVENAFFRHSINCNVFVQVCYGPAPGSEGDFAVHVRDEDFVLPVCDCGTGRAQVSVGHPHI